MSHMSQYYLEMMEDSYYMTKDEFISKYGNSNASVWEQVRDMNWGHDDYEYEQPTDNYH